MYIWFFWSAIYAVELYVVERTISVSIVVHCRIIAGHRFHIHVARKVLNSDWVRITYRTGITIWTKRNDNGGVSKMAKEYHENMICV